MLGDGGEILVGEGDEVGSTRWALFSLRCRGLVGIACFWPNRCNRNDHCMKFQACLPHK